MIDCSYPETGILRKRPASKPGEGDYESMDMDMETSSVNREPAEPVVMEIPRTHAWTGIQPAAAGSTDTYSAHMDAQQPFNFGQNEQLVSAQSMGASNQVAESYSMPEVAEQPTTSAPRDLGYQLPNDDFNGTLAGYPTVTPYDFSLLSNQSIEQPQLGDYGYSAINWLSPKDLGYTEFNYESQFLEVNDFNFWAQPNVIMTPEQNLGYESGALMNQDASHYDQAPSEGVPPTPTHAPEVHTTSPSTSHFESPKTSSTPSRSSNYYVDGAGAREPRYGKLRKQRVDLEGTDGTPIPVIEQDNTGSSFANSFPPSIERYLSEHGHSPQPCLPQNMYSKLVEEFQRNCLSTNHPFLSDHFPSIGIFDLSKQLYFEYFHPIFPLLHKHSTMENPQSWLVELAVAAVGISYLGTQDSRQCSETFSEFLDRCLQSSAASDRAVGNNSAANSEWQDLVKTQGRILCCIAMFHSRNTSLVERAFIIRSQLVGECLRRKMLSVRSRNRITEDQTIHTRWEQFILDESKVRVGYCVFLLDCLMAYQSDFRPQMHLEDGKAPLPYNEEVWEASDETTWHQVYSPRPDRPSLLVALETLYKRKTVYSDIGEFGRILLIHGLYHRTWEVARYHRDTLSNWIPSVPGTRAPSPTAENPNAAGEWLPRNPTFSKWRNSACDCLDVLHWSANSQVAQRAGLEHPTILHLHLARLILLTPAATIQSLASLIQQNAKRGSPPLSASQTQYHEDRSEVLRWFIQDQYKARLALVHAGAVFWHVRRYSHDSMLEPFAVLLATLVVWAYATSSQAIEQQQRQGLANSETNGQSQQATTSSRNQYQNRDSESDPIDLPFINLDRLCDDELIQMYVLHGSRMKGFMAGIGDITKASASVKILREGAKIIACNGTHRGRFLQAADGERSVAALPTWGIGVRQALFLKELADASQRRPG